MHTVHYKWFCKLQRPSPGGDPPGVPGLGPLPPSPPVGGEDGSVNATKSMGDLGY